MKVVQKHLPAILKLPIIQTKVDGFENWPKLWAPNSSNRSSRSIRIETLSAAKPSNPQTLVMLKTPHEVLDELRLITFYILICNEPLGNQATGGRFDYYYHQERT